MIEPDIDWPRNKREEYYNNKYLDLKHKADKIPWYGIVIGFSVASLFWGIMFSVFSS